MVDELEKLREGLRAMPVPEPRPGFTDRVLAAATGRSARTPSRLRAAMSRPLAWWAAGGGALAASFVWAALLLLSPGDPEISQINLALNESREISLVIDSERDLQDATIRLYVTGSVSLVGYEAQREIEWLVSLTRGANLLALPVVGHAPGEGSVVAEIEHEGRIRRLSVAMHVAPPGMG